MSSRKILLLRHSDSVDMTFGINWLNFYDPVTGLLKVPQGTPAQFDYIPVPDVNLPPENLPSVGKDDFNFAENDRRQHPTEPNGTETSVSFVYVPSIVFRSVPSEMASINGPLQFDYSNCHCPFPANVTYAPYRPDGFDAWASDPFLTESGRIMAVAVGQYLRKIKFGLEQFGRRIYVSPSYASIETASCILDGLLGTSREEVEICIEPGLALYPHRFRAVPSYIESSELALHHPFRVNSRYKTVFDKAKLSIKEEINAYYDSNSLSSRNRETVRHLLKSYRFPFLIIVAHAGTLEAVCRTLRGMKPLDEQNYCRCIEGIPFLADACLSEEPNGAWKLTDSPLLRFSQVGNQKQEDWSWLNLDDAQLKIKFRKK
uniref:Uncharacterized protein n=1 Tax=Romanomermis culicivorax TaxID=13658 RepID=A0A915L0Z4_ROMCU